MYLYLHIIGQGLGKKKKESLKKKKSLWIYNVPIPIHYRSRAGKTYSNASTECVGIRSRFTQISNPLSNCHWICSSTSTR